MLDTRKSRMQWMKDIDPPLHIKMVCKNIKTAISKIELPTLEREEMDEMKVHLTEFEKIKIEELKYKFLNLRNAFLIINEMEKGQAKIQPIIEYLDKFRFIFDLIIEDKKDSRTELAMQIMNFEINLFCMKYNYLLIEGNISGVNFQGFREEQAEDFEEKK